MVVVVVIKHASLIRDEAPMANRAVLICVDNICQEIKEAERKAAKPLSRSPGQALPSTDTPHVPNDSTSLDNTESSSTDNSHSALSPETSILLSLYPFHSLPPTHSTIADIHPITFASDSLNLPFSSAFSPIPSISSLFGLSKSSSQPLPDDKSGDLH
ncbi:hypothetical protein EDC04DRAFT_2907531 [Pisolithus marmoratus]|nr:hypothetical protein EDC04DRAFT_2907531 [Pisolithus marmoratus]